MNELILPPDELTSQDRMRAFREDLHALNELATIVHQKAIEGDNAAGHLDLKIRERKASMFGYDSPQRYDMTLIAETKRPSTADAIRRAFDHLVSQGKISDESQQRIRALGGYLPEPGDGAAPANGTSSELLEPPSP